MRKLRDILERQNSETHSKNQENSNIGNRTDSPTEDVSDHNNTSFMSLLSAPSSQEEEEEEGTLVAVKQKYSLRLPGMLCTV
ncbi:hypothetical protein B9Z55_009999 [Caenorhabditis nigoni]|nr:hypothetical protein B9Z55_009999 [Caenorhabditis nigoni]